jgi:trimeric autotransporter adhesin
MAITIKHAKTDTIADWTQGDLDAQIALGNFPAGTVLADIVLPSDWNNDHTISGTVPIANGGTGQTTATAAINALLPSQSSQSGKVLSTDGTNTSWIAAGGVGTVTSVTGTAPVSVATGTTTPVISMTAATSSVDGYLTSTDWNTFNGKGNGTVTSITAGTGLSGGTITASGTIAIDSTVVTLTGTQTLTNKTLTSPKVNEILDASGNEVLGLLSTASATDYVGIKNGIGVGVPLHISSEGSSTNIGLHIQPKGSGLVTISDGTDFNKGIRFRSSSSAASAITLLDAVSTAGRVVTLPDATTTLVGRDTIDTLTNKSISGSTNTLSNIGNASLTNSAITINGTSTSLGGSINVGTVTSVTGTAPVVSSGGATPAISMAAASTTTDGYLTSTDWNTFNSKGSGTVTSVSATSPVTSTGGATPTIAMPAATTSVSGYLTSTDWTTFNNKGSGTVTSVAALTLGTTGTDLSSSVANGTTTPVITLNVPTASATNRGVLSSADWTTFNNKGSGTVTSVSVVSANGLAGSSSGGATPALTLSTTVTGLLKGNGTAISAATSGTDYAPATSGTSILYGDGSGGFSNVTVGTGLSFSAGTLSTTGGAGVTSFQTSLTGLTPSTASTGVVTLAGTLGVASGGTGLTSLTANYVPYGNGTSALANSANFTYNNTTGDQTAPQQVASNGIIVNAKSIASSYTITASNNAMSVGPVTVATGQSVTVSSGSRWVVL